MRPVVAPCHLAIIGQPLLRAIKLRLADDGGHRRDRNPLGRVHDLRQRGAWTGIGGLEGS